MTIAGIDPGKNGAIAFYEDFMVEWRPMPISGKEIDVSALARMIEVHHPDVAFVEKVHAMPGNGAVSMFSFGKGYGILLGVLGALNIRTELVTPQAWKKLVLAGSAKDKDAAISYCRRAFPDVSLIAPRCRTPHDGAADAICISEFG